MIPLFLILKKGVSLSVRFVIFTKPAIPDESDVPFFEAKIKGCHSQSVPAFFTKPGILIESESLFSEL